MRAVVQDRYGSPDVLELRDVDRPTVGDDHVLVRIRAAAINPYDWRFLRADPAVMRLVVGLRRPRRAVICGADMAGVVERVGPAVTRLRPGDAVYGEVSHGCLAEYVSAPEERLALKPANLDFEQAAAVPMAALTALQGLRDLGRIEAGQIVLVNGAGGGIGSFAVQLAKAFGAEVTGVCSSGKLELVGSLGVDHMVDYARTDFTRSGKRYDLLLDTVGNRSLRAMRRALMPRGTLVLAGGRSGRLLGPLPQLLAARLLAPFVGQRLVTFVCKPNREDLELLKGLIESGEIRPVIDRIYPLSGVAEAIRYLEQGHASGKVVITVQAEA
jgi:NADPH:quinone reductase-like Zn-dependent oxidoreductase